MRNFRSKSVAAQVYLEMVFAFMIGMLLLMGMIRVFQWSGTDLIKRRQMHDDLLTMLVGSEAAEPLRQIRPVFYYVADVNATFNSAFLGDAFGP